MSKPQLSKIIQAQIKKPSPIRQIMKMADRKNIINMGLNPDEVISFAGGWVNHKAPEEYRKQYIQICSDEKKFHMSGGYSATLGETECREQILLFEKEIFGIKDISIENIIIGMGSTQLTYDALVTLANPNDTILLLDPTYANYIGQIAFALPKAKIVYLKVFDSKEWEYLPDIYETIVEFQKLVSTKRPKVVLFPSPDNPTSQILDDKLVKAMIEITNVYGTYLVIDHAYKTQYFGSMPKYFSWSPNDYENLVCIHSNSKWARGLGRRLGWMEASKPIIDGMERRQQCSILCPDTLHQMALTSYLKEAIPSGSLKNYLEVSRKAYEKAAKVTLKAIDKHLGMRRLVPQGGLYTVMDVGMDGDEFVRNTLKNTGVLFIPGGGFGKSLKNAVRISYGPLVNNLGKIEEGMELVGEYLGKSAR